LYGVEDPSSVLETAWTESWGFHTHRYQVVHLGVTHFHWCSQGTSINNYWIPQCKPCTLSSSYKEHSSYDDTCISSGSVELL
jgi:hypothetical protein